MCQGYILRDATAFLEGLCERATVHAPPTVYVFRLLLHSDTSTGHKPDALPEGEWQHFIRQTADGLKPSMDKHFQMFPPCFLQARTHTHTHLDAQER